MEVGRKIETLNNYSENSTLLKVTVNHQTI